MWFSGLLSVSRTFLGSDVNRLGYQNTKMKSPPKKGRRLSCSLFVRTWRLAVGLCGRLWLPLFRGLAAVDDTICSGILLFHPSTELPVSLVLLYQCLAREAPLLFVFLSFPLPRLYDSQIKIRVVDNPSLVL
jgi:hypothetical protein